MKFTVNNNILDENKEISIMDLINRLGYHKWCLVILNNKTLLQSDYSITKISNGDKIKIVKPVFGG